MTRVYIDTRAVMESVMVWYMIAIAVIAGIALVLGMLAGGIQEDEDDSR